MYIHMQHIVSLPVSSSPIAMIHAVLLGLIAQRLVLVDGDISPAVVSTVGIVTLVVSIALIVDEDNVPSINT